MTRRTLRFWCVIHKWTSLVCTAFLLMLCVTGLPLIFHDEIARAFDTAPVKAATPRMPQPTVDALVAKAIAARPGEVVQFVFFDPDFSIISVATAATEKTPFAEAYVQSFDQFTGEMIAPPVADSGFLHWMEEAHIRLFMGLPGTLFLGFMGVVSLAALVSGVVIYAPFMRKLPFGTVRKTRNRRIRWLDLHNMIGIVTATWLFVVGATGVLNTLDAPIAGLWQATELREMTAAYENNPPPTEHISVDAAIEVAVGSSPGMRPFSIAFPGNDFSSPHHYGIYLVGDSDLNKYLLRPALIDAETGALTAVRDMPLFVQALFVSRPLHFGDYGGLPLKLIWALLTIAAIIVLCSGLYLWVSRSRIPMDQRVNELMFEV